MLVISPLKKTHIFRKTIHTIPYMPSSTVSNPLDSYQRLVYNQTKIVVLRSRSYFKGS